MVNPRRHTKTHEEGIISSCVFVRLRALCGIAKYNRQHEQRIAAGGEDNHRGVARNSLGDNQLAGIAHSGADNRLAC